MPDAPDVELKLFLTVIGRVGVDMVVTERETSQGKRSRVQGPDTGGFS